MINFHQNIKYLRQLSNLSLNELSSFLGEDMSVSKLSSYEQGVNAKLETIISILNVYNEKFNAGLTLDQIVKSDLADEEYTFPKSNNKSENLFTPNSNMGLNEKFIKIFLDMAKTQQILLDSLHFKNIAQEKELTDLKQKILNINSISSS